VKFLTLGKHTRSALTQEYFEDNLDLDLGRFSSKIALRFKKVCYKIYLCENCQHQSCRAFIGLTIHAKMIDGERPLLPEILDQTDRVGAKSPIFDLFDLGIGCKCRSINPARQ